LAEARHRTVVESVWAEKFNKLGLGGRMGAGKFYKLGVGGRKTGWKRSKAMGRWGRS